MSLREYEAFNPTWPLKNTTGLKCIWNGVASASTQTLDLTTVFGKALDGHYYTLCADGAKVYIAFGSNAGTIDEQAQGSGVTVCWPVPDGTYLPITPLVGREFSYATLGYATLASQHFLHYKTTTGTGYVRLYRSSVAPTQDPQQFPAP